ILLIDAERWVENVLEDFNSCLLLRIDLRQVRPEFGARAAELVTGNAVRDRKNLLAVGEGSAAPELLYGRAKLLQLPFLARSIELEQFIGDWQRVLGQVA